MVRGYRPTSFMPLRGCRLQNGFAHSGDRPGPERRPTLASANYRMRVHLTKCVSWWSRHKCSESEEIDHARREDPCPRTTLRCARLARVSNAVQQGLISALGIPPDDFFQIIHVLPPTQCRHTGSFLGLEYSDDLILLEIMFIAGRPKEKRLGPLKALNDAVVTAAKISPDNLLITLYETPGENISFGRGLAQRAHIAAKEKVQVTRT